MGKPLTYAKAGVNIELGDNASEVLYNASKITWKNREGRFGEILKEYFDNFSGIRVFSIGELPKDTVICLGFDGVGTKIELGERIGKHDTIAYDLFAMVCDDAVVRGGEPVVIGSVLDVNTLGTEEKSYIDLIKQLAEGYIGAAEAAGVAVINGEMAELGARVSGYGEFNYNWGAGVAWVGRKNRLFTGKEIELGDRVIGLRETGFRSNGLSLFRKIAEENYGKDWHLDNPELCEQALQPSKIYCRAVVEMFGGFDGEPNAEIHGFAHFTGGGIPGKIGRVLKPSGYGALIHDPFESPEIMRLAQELGKVTDREAYRTWNMGQGGAVISPEPGKVVSIAEKYGIEARVIGEIVAEHGIRITSSGCQNPGEILKF